MGHYLQEVNVRGTKIIAHYMECDGMRNDDRDLNVSDVCQFDRINICGSKKIANLYVFVCD